MIKAKNIPTLFSPEKYFGPLMGVFTSLICVRFIHFLIDL